MPVIVATSNLQTIQQKVRRLTRSPSQQQLSNADLDQYINTFVLYDFPEHIRLFNLLTTLTFYTQPYVDTYTTVNLPITDPLYDFQNQYLSVNPPIYIAGYQGQFFEDRSRFFGIYPLLNSIASIGPTGDGMTTQFAGVINSQQANIPNNLTQSITLLRNNVLFSSINSAYSGLAMVDTPLTTSNIIGNLSVPDVPPTSTTVQDPNNYINYLTGQFVVTFPSAPGAGQAINSQTIPQQPALPQCMLFYDGIFTLRPVPDQAYAINFEVYQRPTELLANNQNPNLNEWWQYIAYGASKKIFEDRMDLESVQQILPEFDKQQRLCLRRTIVQQTSQRSQTIYCEDTQAAGAYGPGFYSGGGSF